MKSAIDNHRLIRCLEACLGTDVQLAAVLQQALNLEKSAVYNRIAGKTSFTEQEIVTLGRTYPRVLQLYVSMEREKTLGLIQFIESSDEAAFQVQLKQLIKLLEPLPDANVPLHYSALDLPYFYFLSNPDLLLYKLTHWMDQPPKSLQPETKVLAAKVWELYLRIPTRELWMDKAFEQQGVQVEFDESHGLITASRAEELHAIFAHLKEQHHRWLMSKDKGSVVKFRYLPYLRMGNGGFFTLPGQPTQFLGSLHHVTHYHLVQPEVVQRLVKKFEQMWQYGSRIPTYLI